MVNSVREDLVCSEKSTVVVFVVDRSSLLGAGVLGDSLGSF